MAHVCECAPGVIYRAEAKDEDERRREEKKYEINDIVATIFAFFFYPLSSILHRSFSQYMHTYTAQAEVEWECLLFFFLFLFIHLFLHLSFDTERRIAPLAIPTGIVFASVTVVSVSALYSLVCVCVCVSVCKLDGGNHGT